MKKVLHITASYKPAYIYGGPIYSVSALCEALSSLSEYEVTVYTTNANGKEELAVECNKAMKVDNVNVFYFKRLTKDHSHLSPGLLKKLWTTASDFDLIHIHAWWNLVSVLSCVIAVLKKKKFILSPRGTLSTYTFNTNSGKIKNLFHSVVGKWLLKRGHFLVSSENEKEEILKIIAPVSINVVYNILSFLPTLISKTYSNSANLLRLLFLSRIEKKKGLDILFRALANCSFKYHLSIVGDGDLPYINHLQALAVELRIAENINWVGPVYGKEKNVFFLENDVLVLPSFNENFANVVIESLFNSTPVLVSKDVGLANYVKQKDLGWVCDATKVSILEKLEEINGKSAHIIEKSKRAARIAINDFGKEKLLSNYCNVYEQILQTPF